MGRTIVSLFEDLPFFVPDLIYLDGPDPGQVNGSLNGFKFDAVHGLPMAADPLSIEPHLWPGTLLITDGRTANARFLMSNFRRHWEVLHDPWGDHYIMRLAEPPLGEVNELHTAARLVASRSLLGKAPPRESSYRKEDS